MKNDVDPMSMTLSEIYGLPEFYFDYSHQTYLGLDLIRVVYHGFKLRKHGNIFFNMKKDDDNALVDGTHWASCPTCQEWPAHTWFSASRLSLDPDMLRRAHP